MSRLPRVSGSIQGLRTKLADIRERRLEPTKIDADVIEHDEGYTALFDAPGVDPSDVDVRYLDGRIIATLDRYRDSYEGFRRTVSGRRMAFEGEVSIPGDATIDPKAGQATVRADGTLAITVPRATIDTDTEAESSAEMIESPAQD